MRESTSPARAPWWVYLIALPFITAFLFESYVALMGYGPTGYTKQGGTDRLVIGELTPGLPMEKSGVKVGDVIVAVDGQPIRVNDDFFNVRQQFDAEKPVTLTVERTGQQIQLTLVHPRKRYWQQQPWANLLFWISHIALGLVCVGLGLLVLFLRPRDRVALLGAVLLLAFGLLMASPGQANSRAVFFRQLPFPLQLLHFATHFAGAYVVFLFFALFPRPMIRRRWILAALAIPWLAVLPVELVTDYHVFYTPEHVNVVPAWATLLSTAVTMIYVLAGLLIFAVGYRRLQDVNERRRVRLILFGALITFSAVVLFYSLLLFVPNSAVTHFVASSWALNFLFLFLFSVFPVAFAYALLRHRLFDVRVIIRQGLQYAFARRVLVSIVPTALGLLVLDIWLHRDQSIATTFSHRGWLYLAIGGLAFAAQGNRQQWLTALDRRFFRERYNAQQLLAEIVEEIRQAPGFEAQAPRVVARVEAALHPEFVALLARESRESCHHTVASAPAGMAPPAIGADSKLISLLRVLAKPVQVSLRESGWLKQQLPHSDTDFLRESRIELLVPVAMSSDKPEALLALGAKRSEEPYSAEDEELLQSVASALAILIERPAPQPVSHGFAECSQCGAVYDSGTLRCSSDGIELTLSNLSRTLAGRYQLQQRLGRGGMGTVYRGMDTALEREVAVKVIREELIANPGAAERFGREARTAAAFSHPNLVTVFDFGMDSKSRAFLIMELLVGTTLRQEIQVKRTLPLARVVEIMRGVCAAVEAAHQRGLVHRDLKAENIFLVRTESSELPKVLDFGLAKFLPENGAASFLTTDTGEGSLLGTPQYMSPEQLRGQPADKSWDLWSLAVVAYEMIRGVHPFARRTIAECHTAILSGTFERVGESSLDEFFVMALALDQAKRPRTASSFFSQLSGITAAAAAS